MKKSEVFLLLYIAVYVLLVVCVGYPYAVAVYILATSVGINSYIASMASMFSGSAAATGLYMVFLRKHQDAQRIMLQSIYEAIDCVTLPKRVVQYGVVGVSILLVLVRMFTLDQGIYFVLGILEGIKCPLTGIVAGLASLGTILGVFLNFRKYVERVKGTAKKSKRFCISLMQTVRTNYDIIIAIVRSLPQRISGACRRQRKGRKYITKRSGWTPVRFVRPYC